MTVPQVYVQATRDFEKFMRDFKQVSMVETQPRSYAIVRGVLHTFRAHLTVDQALRFADALPAVLRALFVEDWHPSDPPPAFPNAEDLLEEVRSHRRDHIFATETSIRDVATALRSNVDKDEFERALASLPPAAQDYWRT